MSIDTAMGLRVKQARKTKGYSIAEIAQRMAVTEKTIKKWENGKTKPRANKLQTLSGILSVSLAWLIDGNKKFDPTQQSLSSAEIIEQKTIRTVALQQELARLNTEIACELQAQKITTDEQTKL